MILLLSILALTPQQAAIRALADQDLRVATVGYRLARAAAPAFCPGQNLSAGGLVIQDASQYAGPARNDARDALGLGDRPTIVGIVAGGSDALKVGDVILSIDGVPVPVKPLPDPYARVAQVEDGLEASPGGAATLEIKRGAASLRIVVSPTSGCRSRYQIVRGGIGSTQADGRYVQISDGMLALTPTDDALAAVMAHELSHNILRHNVLKTGSKQAEYEADALSVRLVALAGYDLDAVLPFWESLRKRADYGIFADGTHPGWRKRMAALTAAVAKAKEAASQSPKAR